MSPKSRLLDVTIGSNASQARSEKPLPLTLRELRHEKGLGLTEAAVRAGLHKGRLSELERGDRAATRHELTALEQAYGVGLRVVHAIVVDEGEKA